MALILKAARLDASNIRPRLPPARVSVYAILRIEIRKMSEGGEKKFQNKSTVAAIAPSLLQVPREDGLVGLTTMTQQTYLLLLALKLISCMEKVWKQEKGLVLARKGKRGSRKEHSFAGAKSERQKRFHPSKRVTNKGFHALTFRFRIGFIFSLPLFPLSLNTQIMTLKAGNFRDGKKLRASTQLGKDHFCY